MDETSVTKTQGTPVGFEFHHVESIEARARRAGKLVAERAAREGLLDVAYGFAESPFGPLLVATTRRGLVRVAYPDLRPDEVLERLAREISPRVLESPQATEEIRRELEEYFDRKRRTFAVPVDLSRVQGFGAKILRHSESSSVGSISAIA